MSGLRNGRDGLFPKIKYQNYTLITLREINYSAGACGGQNAGLPMRAWGIIPDTAVSTTLDLLEKKLFMQSRTDFI